MDFEESTLFNAPSQNLNEGVIDKTTFPTSRSVISGAVSRDDTLRQEVHAEEYYAAIRKRVDDVDKIAKNTSYSVTQIHKIKTHLFLTKHDLGKRDKYGNAVLQYFDPDFDQAVSWQNLCDGKNIREMDLVLLQHELYELELMKSQGLSYSEAHILASQRYDYHACCELLNKQGGL